MPRQLRKRFPGAKYHVMNRGNGRQRVFYDENDYSRFFNQLTYALETDSVTLYAYCLMPNHFHLFVETPHANIDEFMRRLCTAYGLYFRYRHRRPGHCFQGRYKAPLVQGDDYILRLTRYIHLNPVKIHSALTLPDGEKWGVLKRHKWSSLEGYINRRYTADCIDYRWLELLGSQRAQRRQYREYLAQMFDMDDPILGQSMMSSSYAIGDESFRDEVDMWVRKQSAAARTQGDIAVPSQAVVVAVEDVACAVAGEFGLSVETLNSPRLRVGHARGFFVELACRLCQFSQRDLARFLGNVSEHAVGNARRRLHEALLRDERLALRLKMIEDRLKAKG